MSPTSYQTAPPRVKLGTNYTTRDQHRSTETLKHKKARTRRACLFGTEEGLEPLQPMATTTSR